MRGTRPLLKRVPHMSKRMLKAQHVRLTFPTMQALFRLKGNALKVYVCLCRHANSIDGIAFPSIVLIARETHLDRATVVSVFERELAAKLRSGVAGFADQGGGS